MTDGDPSDVAFDSDALIQFRLRWWPRALAFLLVGILVCAIMPRIGYALDSSTDMPGTFTLLLTGVSLTLLTAGLLYVALKRELGVASSFVWYAFAFNALIIVVKFVLAPHSYYLQEFKSPLQSGGMFDITPDVVAGGWPWAFTGILVFLLYALVWGGLYRFQRRRVRRALVENLVVKVRTSKSSRRWVVIALVAVISAATMGVALLVFLALVFGSVSSYLKYIFSTGWCFAIAGSLTLATVFAARVFDRVADRAIAMRDASMLTMLFWVGLSLLAIYHVLWVVYIMAVISIWPLKVVHVGK